VHTARANLDLVAILIGKRQALTGDTRFAEFTDGVYQSAFMTTPERGGPVRRAPSIGGNLRRAVDQVTVADGVPSTVTWAGVKAHLDTVTERAAAHDRC
jgi:hypothetical protein